MVTEGIQGAELIYAERAFKTMWPVKIVAKMYRGYRSNTRGVIVLLELKTRRASRTYLSDVIGLSAQRFAVTTQTKERMLDTDILPPL